MGRDRRLQTRATRFFNNTSSESKQLRALRRSPAPFSSVPVHLGSPTAGRQAKAETWKVRPQTSPSRSAGHPLIGHPGLSRRGLSSALGFAMSISFSFRLALWSATLSRSVKNARSPHNQDPGTNWPIEARFRQGGDATTRCGVCLGAAGACMTRVRCKPDLNDALGNVFAAF